jgi:predicted homoserine dehydrogenase-like protein
MLKERAAAGKPVRIGQIGAGKFGTMFLSQVRLTDRHAPDGPRPT